MKLRRILAVLLALALLPGLLPSASADHVHSWRLQATRREPTCTEPGTGVYVCDCGERKTDTIPALGHSWGGWATTQAATCGKAGTQTRTCSRCGKTETKTIPATGAHSFGSWKIIQQTDCLVPGSMSRTCSVCGYTETQSMPAPGHDWGEGVVVKEAGYLEDGEIVYTCGRNPAHTKTETIPKLEAPENTSVMSLLRNGNPGYQTMSNPLPLRITVQPEGGAITRGSGETLAMSVEAAGGEAPYTYEWFREYTGESAWAAFIAMVFAKKNGSIWISASNTTYANLPDFAYYCKVTDSNGKYVYSEKAPVTAALRVKTQPLNTNMYGKDSVTLICEAGDGTPGYSYGWIGPDGSLLDNPDTNDAGNELTVSEPGPYTCWIMDSGGGEIYSDTCTVYSQKPLTISEVSGMLELDKGEEATISCVISGGDAPYIVTWQEDGVDVSTTDGGQNTYTLPVTGSGENEVIYTVKAVDSMGAEESAKVSVLPRDYSLCITSLNSYEIIDKLGDEVEFRAKVEGGVPPYSYRWRKTRFDPEFEQNNGMITESTDFIENGSSFRVNEPFTAWELTVKDAAGTRITSQTLLVAYDGEFEIFEQPENVIYNTYYRDEIYNCTMSCKAMGPLGHEYRYVWEKKENSGWVRFYTGSTMKYNERKTDTHFYYIQDGIFRCRVTDLATGKELISREAKLTLPKIQVTAFSKGTSVFLTIEGGKGPYTITSTGRENEIAKNWTIYGAYSLSPGQVKTIAEGSRWLEVEITGLARREKHWADEIACWKYNFAITDILGNTAEVSVQIE